MKTHRTRRTQKQQGRCKDFQQTKALEVQRWLPFETILEYDAKSTTETRGHGENLERGNAGSCIHV